MKLRILFAGLLISMSTTLFSQSLIGVWLTFDEKTKQPASEIEFYQRGNKYYGKVIKVYKYDTQNKKMSKEEIDEAVNAILGMILINDLTFNTKKNTYENGYFKFPNFDIKIDCKIAFAKANYNKINVEARFGIISKKLTWERVK